MVDYLHKATSEEAGPHYLTGSTSCNHWTEQIVMTEFWESEVQHSAGATISSPFQHIMNAILSSKFIPVVQSKWSSPVIITDKPFS